MRVELLRAKWYQDLLLLLTGSVGGVGTDQKHIIKGWCEFVAQSHSHGAKYIAGEIYKVLTRFAPTFFMRNSIKSIKYNGPAIWYIHALISGQVRARPTMYTDLQYLKTLWKVLLLWKAVPWYLTYLNSCVHSVNKYMGIIVTNVFEQYNYTPSHFWTRLKLI